MDNNQNENKKQSNLSSNHSHFADIIEFSSCFSENVAPHGTDNKLARVACLGDSITQLTGYSEDLQELLGNNSIVGNYGVTGSTVNFNTNEPYYYELAFRHALAFEPTTVIIMLGTNDARNDTYQQISTFISNYEKIISRVQALSSKPQIFLVEPPPIFNNTLDLNGTIYVEGVIPRIQQVANALGLPTIDVYTPLLNHLEYFPDGVHPNSAGAQIIANTVYNAIRSESK